MKSWLFTSSLLLLVLTACRQASPHDQQIKTLKTIHSWAATAEMVGEAWTNGQIPNQYAQQTLAKSQAEIAQARNEITDTAISVQIQQLDKVLAQINSDIQQQHQSAIAEPLHQLTQINQQLDALIKQ
ncbi:hypothetical protein [Pantanalinema sp. GBBB05]|uniref:hypothetical protein n=1 Tax=Pantanalinema sp. GBBB05 TaxID=2604139 RepID=UPI001D93FB12|nr:hypothetical protein [Pantanalinema sp. GBBB05]